MAFVSARSQLAFASARSQVVSARSQKPADFNSVEELIHSTKRVA
jgi:hypothetical protein